MPSTSGTPHEYDAMFPWLLDQSAVAKLTAPVVEEIFPLGTPLVGCFTQVSKVRKPAEWATRIPLNALAVIAQKNTSLASAMMKQGLNSPECRLVFRDEWRGFLTAVAYPTPAVDYSNLILFTLLILKNAILIEEVRSIKDGQSGGWNLIQHLSDHLSKCAPFWGITTLLTSATTPRSADLF